MNLLIVDDARAVHAFIKEALHDFSGEISDAFDGDEALQKLTSNQEIEMVLLDWQMPRLSGLDTLKNIRAKGIATPIIMVTSMGDVAHIEAALEAGADDYIMKPFTRDILLDKIEKNRRV